MDNDLIDAFHRDFHTAKDRSEERQAIVKSCERLKSKEQAHVIDLAADAAAIIWLVRQRWGTTVDVPRSVPEGEILIRLSSKVPTKKLYSVKHLIALWGPTKVRHYRFDLLGERALRQLVHAAGTYRDWTEFVGVVNSVMLWRHEQCATSTSSQKNKTEFLIGQYPVACNASTRNRPLLPFDIENIKKSKHTDFATRERLQLWTSPCVTCFEKNVKHKLPSVPASTVSFLLLKRDHYHMLVPSNRATRVCADCCPPANIVANKKRKRAEFRVTGSLAAAKKADGEPQSLLSCVRSLSPAPPEILNRIRLEDDARALREAGKASADTVGPEVEDIGTHERGSFAALRHGQSSQTQSRRSSGAQNNSLSPEDRDLESESSRHSCPFCEGECTRCEVPEGYSSSDAVQLYSIVHQMSKVNSKDDSSCEALLSFIHFAHPLNDLGKTNERSTLKAWILPWGEKLEDYLASPTELLPEVLVIRDEQFSDVSRYSPQHYAEMLRLYCGGKDIPTRVDGDATLNFCDGNEIADHLLGKCSKLQNKVVNVLSLKGITNAIKPSFTRILRFCFLQALIHRAKAEESYGNAGKQTYKSPFDVSSCTDFNILGFDGAYSGAHVDLLGATWLRCLFGIKLWWYVPRSSMTLEDWKTFKLQGAAWNPGDKAKAVLLKPGDVLVMFEPVVHLVFTVQTCLMEGAMFCDSDRRTAFVSHLKDIIEMPYISNEPMAYQIPSVIEELEDVLRKEEDGIDKANVMNAIRELRATRCWCRGRCDATCSCHSRRSRCTQWCKNHPSVPLRGFTCMKEN